MRLSLLFAVLCGCTVDHAYVPTDPSGTTPTTPTGAAPVALTVRSGSAPQSGIAVIFQGPDGAVIAEVATDATGVAKATVPAGGAVIALRPQAVDDGQPPLPDLVYAYLGVQPGDRLELDGPAISIGPTSVDVTVPNIDPDPDVTGPVTVVTPCGTATGDSPVVTVALDGCGPETDFVVTDNTGGGSFVVRDVMIQPELDLSGADLYHASLMVTVGATNVPALPGGTTVLVEKQLETAFLHPAATTGAVDASAGPVTVVLPNLSSVEQVVSATMRYPTGETLVAASRGPTMSTAAMVDVGAAMIAVPSAPALSAGQIAWTESTGGAADLVIAHLTTPNVIWSIAAPAALSVHVPALPAAHVADSVSDADAPMVDVSLVRITGGYDVARPTIFNHPAGAELAPMLGTATVATSAIPAPVTAP